MKHVARGFAAIAAAVVVIGCTKQEVVESPRFDAKAIAAEADKGNLGPLKDLNTACSAEVEKSGKRGVACSGQDDVGALRKPMAIKF